jgi:hypothetical protein
MLDALALAEAGPRASHGGDLALIAASPTDAAHRAMCSVVERMSAIDTILHVNAEMVNAALGAAAATRRDDDARVAEWMCKLQADRRPLVYECDARDEGWAARCIRGSDRLVVFLPGYAGPDDVPAVVASASRGGVKRQLDVVLVHPESTELPSGTRDWSAIAGAGQIHHVRQGLRVSGGGARGFSHLGVLAAIREAGQGGPASPPLFDILVRSSLVGSKLRQTASPTDLTHVLHIEPPVEQFGILSWRAHEALFDAGYRHAKERIVSMRSSAAHGAWP